MGTFQGHLLPGCLFVVFGVWWTAQIVRRAIMCNMQRRPFYASVTYPCPMHGRCVNWPLEAAVKAIVTLIGMVLELYAATNYGSARGFVFMGDLQHVTMYAFFFLSGVIDIVQAYDKLPEGLDYITISLAFLAEGILFSGHLHGRNMLDMHLHQLLVLVIFTCVAATLLEYKWNNSTLPALARAYFVLLQGTWFIQVGFILYNPIQGAKPWDSNDHNQLMVATMYFTWHFFGAFAGLLFVGWLSSVLVRRLCRPTTEDLQYELLPAEVEPLTMMSDGHTLYPVDNDEEPQSDEDPYSGLHHTNNDDLVTSNTYSKLATDDVIHLH